MKHDVPKTAAILAGGLGTRLRSVVADRPKVLAQVNGRPFITYLLDQLAAEGIESVVLCTGYMADQITKSLGDHYQGMQLRYSVEMSPLGTAGALRHALPLFSSFPVLVMNGDSFFDADLPSLAAMHVRANARGSIALAFVNDVSRYGAVEIASDHSIIRFTEKGNRTGPGLINSGIYLLEAPLIEAIPPDTSLSLEIDVFPSFIGHGLFGFPQPGKFLDIGVPVDYQAAASFFLNRDFPFAVMVG